MTMHLLHFTLHISSKSTSNTAQSHMRALCTLQRTNTAKQIFPEKELCGHSPNFYIHVSWERFVYSHKRSAYSAAGVCVLILGIYKTLTDT